MVTVRVNFLAFHKGMSYRIEFGDWLMVDARYWPQGFGLRPPKLGRLLGEDLG
jgi:hypothetical protein